MINLDLASGQANLPKLTCPFEEFAAAAPKMPGPDDNLSEAEWTALIYDPFDAPDRWAAFCKWRDDGGWIDLRAQVRNLEAEKPHYRQEEQPASPDDHASLATKFLMLLRPAGPWQLTAIDPNVKGKIVTRTIKTPDAALGFIREYDGKRNLYFSVNPVRVENIKASKTDIAAIEFVFGDLDPRDDEAADPAKDRYLAALKPFQPAPTFLIDSGNGVQVLWRLDQPIALPKPIKGVDAQGKPIWVLAPEAQTIVDDVEARVKAVMEKLDSVAGTQNIDRILRLPWTTNLPNEVKRKKGRTACRSSLVSSNASVCMLEDFPAPSQHAESNSGNASAGSADGHNSNTNGAATGNTTINWAAIEQHKGWLKSVANLPVDFSAKGKAIIAHTSNLKDLNFDLQHANALVKPYQSWSEVAFALTAIFKSDGRYSNEQIAAALLTDLECNQHIKHQANKQRAIERLILRSHEPPAGKVRKAGAPNWREQNKDGAPRPSMHNARLAITALGVECSYDTFHNKLLFGFKDDHARHAVEHMLGEVTDKGIISLRQLMSDTFGFDLTDKHTRDAVISLALEHCFDPVVDMLKGIEAALLQSWKPKAG